MHIVICELWKKIKVDEEQDILMCQATLLRNEAAIVYAPDLLEQLNLTLWQNHNSKLCLSALYQGFPCA